MGDVGELFDCLQGIRRADGVALIERFMHDRYPPSISGQFLDDAVSRGVDVVEAVTQYADLRADNKALAEMVDNRDRITTDLRAKLEEVVGCFVFPFPDSPLGAYMPIENGQRLALALGAARTALNSGSHEGQQ